MKKSTGWISVLGIGALIGLLVWQINRDLSQSEELWHPITDRVG